MPLLDTSTSKDNLDGRFIADLVLQILSYTAEKERENTRKRQAQGIAVMPVVNGKKVSLKTGNPVGRPNAAYPESWETVYNTWKSGDITAMEAMKQLSLTKTTFYKLVKLYEKKAQ
jgi:DNA invertase Pin-like site-specific DNA recombinase